MDTLPNGMEDLARWEVEDNEENRDLLERFLPREVPAQGVPALDVPASIVEYQEENEQMDQISQYEWSQHQN